MKAEAKRQLGITNGINPVLESISGEEWKYDPSREWKLDWSRTHPSDHGPTTEVVLNQAMGALLDSSIPYQGMIFDVCLQAFDDKFCVPRALAEISDINMTLDEICLSFDAMLNHTRWRNMGLTPRQLEQWCLESGRPVFIIFRTLRGWTTRGCQPEEQLGKSIAFCAHDSHCFMYRDAHVLAKMAKEDNLPEETHLVWDVKPIIQGEFISKAPEFALWERWSGTIKPGNFYTGDLKVVREQLCNMGRSPLVSMRDRGAYSRLVIECVESLDSTKGKCCIQEIRAPQGMDVDDFVSKVGEWLKNIYEMTGHVFKWKLEGLPYLALSVMKRLMRASRQRLSRAEKLNIQERQNYKCANCHEAGIDEFDHITPLRVSNRTTTQHFQGLCTACHSEVTRFESDSFRLESHFSPFAWKSYVSTARAPNLAFRPHRDRDRGTEVHAVEYDIRRCRQNSLRHYNLASFPCFCALDSVKELDMTNLKLGDLNFIQPRDGRLSELMMIPLCGAMWYSELVARHALETGLIQWSDVKLTMTATGRIPKECFEHALDIMCSAWSDDDMEKASVNQLVGLMQKEFLTKVKCVTTQNELPSYGKEVMEFTYEDDGETKTLYDHITVIPMVTCKTFRPIHDCIMGWEAVQLARLRDWIEKCGVPRQSITDVKTDALRISGGQRKRKALDMIELVTYEGTDRMHSSGMNRYRQGDCSYPIRHGDTGLVYKREARSKKPLPGETYDKIQRCVEPCYLTKTWHNISTRNASGETDFSDVHKWVMSGNSIYIDGMGGAGKTTLGQDLVKNLRAAGKTLKIIAKTHNACLRFGYEAMTADKWCNWHVKKAKGGNIDVLFIEEVSMINVGLWSAISTFVQKGKLQLILSGDLFQLDPPKNSWCGADVPEYALATSDLFYELSGGARCYLDQNMRSDAIIFEFGKTLRTQGVDFKERLEAAKLLFPATDRIPDCVLCISHAKRKRVNEWLNTLLKPENAMRLEIGDYHGRCDWEPQDMWIWPGMKVIGEKKPCRKSQLYEVTACGKSITVKAITHDGSDEPAITIPIDNAPHVFRMSFACTYARAQGLTLQGLIFVSDCENPNFTIRHLNMGITRATHSSLVEVRV